MEQKADADVKREMQMASLRHDISTAPKLRDVVLGELKAGVRPEWLAVKYGHYGITLEKLLIAKAAIDRQKEKQREREDAARGNLEAPEIGQVSYGSGGT